MQRASCRKKDSGNASGFDFHSAFFIISFKIETAVAAGEAERTVIVDPALAVDSEDNEGLLSSENENSTVQSMKKIVTVGILKPDVVSDQNKTGKILDMIEQNGIEIVADEEKILNADDVASLYVSFFFLISSYNLF